MKFTQRLLIPCSMLLIATFTLAGCGSHDEHADESKDKGHAAHRMVGDHGGMIVEWGDEEYHPEYVRDAKKKEVTVYIYDDHVEKLDSIAAKEIKLTITSETPNVDVILKAQPQKDDPKGESTRFVGTHEKFGAEGKLKGVLRAEIGGTKYSGRFDEAKKKK